MKIFDLVYDLYVGDQAQKSDQEWQFYHFICLGVLAVSIKRQSYQNRVGQTTFLVSFNLENHSVVTHILLLLNVNLRAQITQLPLIYREEYPVRLDRWPCRCLWQFETMLLSDQVRGISWMRVPAAYPKHE